MLTNFKEVMAKYSWHWLFLNDKQETEKISSHIYVLQEEMKCVRDFAVLFAQLQERKAVKHM